MRKIVPVAVTRADGDAGALLVEDSYGDPKTQAGSCFALGCHEGMEEALVHGAIHSGSAVRNATATRGLVVASVAG